MKIIDCTFRDGGYYTNWDFSRETVSTYLKSFNNLPVDYLELGYRSNPVQTYLGEFFYCPVYLLEELRQLSNKKLAIILNEKDVGPGDAGALLSPVTHLVDLVRIAIDPKNIRRAMKLAAGIKKLGFEVAFNVMYMSTWAEQKDFIPVLRDVGGIADYFYMVDSFGGVYPQDVRNTMDLVREQTNIKLGFHGHNNLEMALANTLAAIDYGVDIVDATITGTGRGAGNLKTELLLTVLESKSKMEIDYNALSKAVDVFADLQKNYEWGTNLPYMVSGAYSLPQKDVMAWVSKRFYSFNSIIRALTNKSKGQEDNTKLQNIDFSKEKEYSSALIVGGGPSAVQHAAGIDQFLRQYQDMIVIHASSKNAMSFSDVANDQLFCLVGNEGYRLESVFSDAEKVRGKCILPPFPRKMGTYIPTALKNVAYELKEVTFTPKYQDSHTALAIQTALELGLSKVYVTGYDGYSGSSMGEKEQELFRENEGLFKSAVNAGLALISITPSQYDGLEEDSVYAHI